MEMDKPEWPLENEAELKIDEISVIFRGLFRMILTRTMDMQ